MRYVQFKKCLAVLSVLVLTATGLWAAGEEEGSTAAAAEKKYVTDPTTGEVVVRAGVWRDNNRPRRAPVLTQANPHDPYFGYVAVP